MLGMSSFRNFLQARRRQLSWRPSHTAETVPSAIVSIPECESHFELSDCIRKSECGRTILESVEALCKGHGFLGNSQCRCCHRKELKQGAFA